MHWFRERVIDEGHLPLFVCLASFIVTFLATRLITRLIRAGRGPFKDNVSSGGLHVHHAVPGIILLVTGAFIALAAADRSVLMHIAAALVGVGTSLVLDEFALILHLRDVYWAEEGRVSVQIVSLAMCTLGLALLGLNPIGTFNEHSFNGVLVTTITVLAVLVHLTMVALCLAKGRLVAALFGAFIPGVVWFVGLRLARPQSRWARRRYGPDKLARATARDERHQRRFGRWTTWIGDLIAGAPSTEPTADA